MVWTVELSSLAKKNLKQFDPQVSRRILSFLLERVACLENPRLIGELNIGRILEISHRRLSRDCGIEK